MVMAPPLIKTPHSPSIKINNNTLTNIIQQRVEVGGASMIIKQSTDMYRIADPELFEMTEEDMLEENLRGWLVKEIFEDIKTDLLHKDSFKYTDLEKELREEIEEQKQKIEDELDFIEFLEEGVGE